MSIILKYLWIKEFSRELVPAGEKVQKKKKKKKIVNKGKNSEENLRYNKLRLRKDRAGQLHFSLSSFNRILSSASPIDLQEKKEQLCKKYNVWISQINKYRARLFEPVLKKVGNRERKIGV